MATGLAKVTVCQPDEVSPLKVAWASRCPAALQRLPTWVPVLAAALWKRTPVTEPSRSALKATPNSTGLASPESTVAGVAKSKMVARGVTAFDAADAGLVPTAFVAVTLNV